MSVRDQRVSGEGKESEVRQTLSSYHSMLALLGFPGVVVEIPHFLSFK
ncbi:MAG: hypothetical protein LW716_19470 [Microcystis sp. 53602_E8]|nr:MULTISPECIES: hypothetical protein [Microcystis]AKV66963.1 hypothetical protein VL20_1828 [Microcystis panniformis FACHB-1757]MCE2661361.1 hypothetical protein [Microcystis sp. 53602_E8]MDJ0527166.1 hypothetical protein [Microcystis sp. M53600_WE12]ODV37249.1 hypothetical protein BFG60_3149 [Microcystis aeruginosa NIES-98]MCE2664772.1 hypothetical protein [Microcystis sp. 53602_E8]